jgi:ABC-type multidrug transport system permease subunit
MNNSFLNLVAIQFREFVREPASLFWALVFPIGLSGVLGLAFAEKETVTSRVAVERNQYLSMLQPRLQALGPDTLLLNQFAFRYTTREAALLSLKRGEIALILEPTPGGRITYHFDPRNDAARTQYLLLEKELREASAVRSEVKPVSTQGSRYIDFLIPGMIALGIMNSCIWGIGWGVIEWRIKKLLRQMVATPMRKTEFLLAHFATRLVLTLIEAGFLVLFGWTLFGLSVLGSPLAFAVVFASGVAAFGGIAILVASRPQKTYVGSGMINFVTLSFTIVSGIFFSYTNFPGWAAGIIEYMPLTILADLLRKVFNEGAGLAQIAGKSVVLLGYGTVCFFAGMRVFKWY